jgi:F-type H+-transporting ATPase subunit a
MRNNDQSNRIIKWIVIVGDFVLLNAILLGFAEWHWRVESWGDIRVDVFILVNNIVGVIPGCKPGTGCIGTTAALALVSFVYFIVVGMKNKGVVGYIKSLAPAGVAFPMNALVWVIEVFSTFLRLVTLAVRLFCNLFAGHVVLGTFAILASLFFEPLMEGISAAAVGQAGASVFWVAILMVIYAVELLVAAIQAYVFTLLSAVYIQLAEAEEH